MSERQLVLQPRGTAQVNGPVNFERSVRRGVRIADHADALGASRGALEALYPDGVAKLWGSTPTNWTGNAKAVALRDRAVGDRVLFYADMAFFAEATIVGLFRNRALAESVWGTDDEGATWEHVMALGEVREFERPIPADQVLKPLGMRAPLRGITLVSAERHALADDLVTTRETRQPRHWVLQCNPKKWDVWSWWENREERVTTWSVAQHLNDLRTGDRFALWISGAHAGVHALGTVTSEPYQTEDFDEYWAQRPALRHVVDVRFDRFLFDHPLTKQELTSDPAFANARIIRMTHAANPTLLEPAEWAVVEPPADRRGRSSIAAPTETVVTSRPVGSIPEKTTAADHSGTRVVDFPEAKLVKRYTEFVGRALYCLSALLPTGERLVCDLFDSETNTLIEAKASNTRESVRMALGQLLDYRHHLAPDATLACLLPACPAPSIVDVLHSHQVKVIYEAEGSFRTLV
ncbi:EVE domain-containing protein [Amycolatopsis sp. CA-161197]|uniref:EVE domain-containing protein n=1 Tax=Amycolatopsis sp. CA-161197 TaxID=3239922 RepID=UPI003D92CB9B